MVFGEERSQYASSPQSSSFTFREETRSLRRLLFPTLEKYAAAGCYWVPRESVKSISGLTSYQPPADLLVVPLQTPDAQVGALLFDMDERPADETLRDLRTFADLAAWMIDHEREVSAAEREARQSALLAQINERSRNSLDRRSILESVVEDVRASFDALRCTVFGIDPAANDRVRAIASAESASADGAPAAEIPIASTWLDRVFAGSVVSRDRLAQDNPRDAFLREAGAGSALMVPLVIDGRVEHAIELDFASSDAFDEIDLVMLRSVASHVGLALANVQLYDLERLRRARAESLERVVRMLRDTQTLEEVMLVFAVTVSHEVRLTCATYELEGATAVRRAVRTVEPARGGVPEQFDIAHLPALFEHEDLVASSALPPAIRASIFGGGEGLLASLRIDGNLWGAIVFAGAADSYDWSDPERRVYFHMLASHLELALSGALGFERIQHLARALSESNEFKDDLLAMLAHDFKGPLTVISGYCELLLENAPAELHEELETIYSQTKRLVRLSEDAVALAQTQAGGFPLDRSPMDLRDLVAQSAKAHNRGNERIRVIAPEEPIEVRLDSARFNHVLDNLLMNALKYSQDEVLVRLTRGESNATIAISDRGIGIPGAELGTVFSRFGRASNARRKGISGSGVGLYVSRKIVEVHGGSIAVQSTEGAGSTFTVTLPLATSSNH